MRVKGKVIRLMNGMEKRVSDCYNHALYLRDEGTLAVVVTDCGDVIRWPLSMTMDDATDEEVADFYDALNKTRSAQRAEYKEERS